MMGGRWGCVYWAKFYGELGLGELLSKWPLNLLKMKNRGFTSDLEFPTFHDLTLGSTQHLGRNKTPDALLVK
jgi:hypothetical protein